MGVYVSINGWLECDDSQLDRIREIAAAADTDPDCTGGWTFPARQPMWGRLAFFGADMRRQYAETVLEQLRKIARLPACDADDDRVRGLFVMSHEVDGVRELQVRGGKLVVVDPGSRYDYLVE